MNQKKLLIMLICCVLFFIANCNIFDWTIKGEEELFYDGLKLFNQKKFEEAEEKFAKALALDSLRSDYRYYHAKATVFKSDINFFAIGRQIIDADKSGEYSLPLYSRITGKEPEEDDRDKNAIYNITIVSHDDLNPIFQEKTHGEIKPEDIYFEYCLISYARALLQLRDTNNDGQINEEDFYFSIVKKTIGDSTIYEIRGLDNPDFKYYLIANYETFNNVLTTSLLNVVEGSISLYKATGDTTLFDNEELNEIMDRVESTGSYYLVNDGEDNDGDGRIDEELLNGNDDDLDGIVDEDTRLFP